MTVPGTNTRAPLSASLLAASVTLPVRMASRLCPARDAGPRAMAPALAESAANRRSWGTSRTRRANMGGPRGWASEWRCGPSDWVVPCNRAFGHLSSADFPVAAASVDANLIQQLHLWL